jgi:hypothetical protein
MGIGHWEEGQTGHWALACAGHGPNRSLGIGHTSPRLRTAIAFIKKIRYKLRF